MKDPHGAIIHVAALSEECPEMEADQLTQICHKIPKVPMDACCPDQNHQRMEDCTGIYERLSKVEGKCPNKILCCFALALKLR